MDNFSHRIASTSAHVAMETVLDASGHARGKGKS